MVPMAHRSVPRFFTSPQRAFTCQHLGLARQQAHRFGRRWALPVDDLLGPAYERLCKGAIADDPSRGFRPSSHLMARVKGEWMHHLRNMGFSLRIAHRLRELWLKGRKYIAQDLNDRQIAARLDGPLQHLQPD
jgi:DNA-directed RNA polymerase specialized sigma subunit